jgi:hypothetical protein
MFDNEDMRDAMYSFFNRMAGEFDDASSPGSRLYPIFLQYFLESQRSFLKWYQEYVDDQSLQDSAEDRIKKMTKAFMSSYMEFMKSQRENRDHFIRMQSEFMKNYLSFFDDMLNSMNERKR